MLVERYALRPDSGGAGPHRGGLGAEMVVQALAPFSLTTRDRPRALPALGPGRRRRGGRQRDRHPPRRRVATTISPTPRCFSVRLRKGDAFMMQSGGGGGFGAAHRRATPQQVARDVRLGYVSRDMARETYGVVLRADGTTDEPATAARRAGMPCREAGCLLPGR